MEAFRSLLHTLTAASLLLAAAQVYLTLNKLWKRKHERVVAESISLAGETIGLVPLLLLSLTFAIDGQWLGLVDTLLWVGAAAVTLAIGTGLWVSGGRRRGFLNLVRDALRLEREEVGYLARALLRPSHAQRILDILSHVALLDDHLDPREQAFLKEFADSWGVDLSWDEVRARAAASGSVDLLRLRQEVAGYLETGPPEEQVRQVGDVLRALVAVDEDVSPEEGMLVEEVDGMFAAYLQGAGAARTYAVTLVPQDPGQDRAIANLLEGVEKTPLHGGSAYIAARYHSRRFAEVVGEEYRALGFFTTVVAMAAEAGAGEPVLATS